MSKREETSARHGKQILQEMMASCLDRGLLVEDVLEALRLAIVARRKGVAQTKESRERKSELRLFYDAAEVILLECIDHMDEAGVDAERDASERD